MVWGLCVCGVFFVFRCKFLLPEGEKSPSCQIIIVRLQVLLSHGTGSASPGLFSKRGSLAFGRRKCLSLGKAGGTPRPRPLHPGSWSFGAGGMMWSRLPAGHRGGSQAVRGFCLPGLSAPPPPPALLTSWQQPLLAGQPAWVSETHVGFLRLTLASDWSHFCCLNTPGGPGCQGALATSPRVPHTSAVGRGHPQERFGSNGKQN